ADGDEALRRRHDAAHDADQRGLAGPVWTEQREDLPAADVEVDVLQRLEAARVAFRESADFDDRFGRHAGYRAQGVTARACQSSPWVMPVGVFPAAQGRHSPRNRGAFLTSWRSAPIPAASRVPAGADRAARSAVGLKLAENQALTFTVNNR